MTVASLDRRVFQLFADLLDYPRPGLGPIAEHCAALVGEEVPAAATLLREFSSFATGSPQARLEETYTGLFELDASHHPYVGYHLFGESYKRSAFLLGLKARYRRYGIECGTELPDHVAAVLRFLAANEDPEEAQELIREALYPALGRMAKGRTEEPPDPDVPQPARPGSPYRGLLHALVLLLETRLPDVRDPAAGTFVDPQPSLACE
ncbi:MAG: molecular chaperone TorD family protein [Deltaproteobacteria bacterium]|nr:molecular chaperone TorD family protein [Deltaproteobacteria bacterium]